MPDDTDAYVVSYGCFLFDTLLDPLEGMIVGSTSSMLETYMQNPSDAFTGDRIDGGRTNLSAGHQNVLAPLCDFVQHALEGVVDGPLDVWRELVRYFVQHYAPYRNCCNSASVYDTHCLDHYLFQATSAA
jgi:hypothetical protein